jgi:hypothetical protein
MLIKQMAFKLLNDEGVWQELLRKKYLYSKTLSQVTSKRAVGDGQSNRFWEDTWLEHILLLEQYPTLCTIVRPRNVLVADVLANNSLNVEFTRILFVPKWAAWFHLAQRLMALILNDEVDSFVWKLTDSGLFSVKSMYTDFMNGQTVYLIFFLET